MVNAIDVWGLEETLKECVGMFAFAAYNLNSNKLFLARDRFGEKPLYYGVQKGIFSFSSEIKSLRKLEAVGWKFNIDQKSVSLYSKNGYIVSPFSIYENISKLEPGCYLEVTKNNEINSIPYWDPDEAYKKEKFPGSYSESVDILEKKLMDSVSLQMSADVPLGAFLSGGIDSSVIVAILQSMKSDRINTFSIGFDETYFNEATYAREVAKYIGTNHTEMYINEKDALSIIPNLPDIYDEPFADSSQVPTFLASQLAKSKVAVSLSGDGSDEVFGGYTRYHHINQVKNKLNSRVYRNRINISKGGLHLTKFIPGQIGAKSHRRIEEYSILKGPVMDGVSFYQDFYAHIHDSKLWVNNTDSSLYKNKIISENENLSYQEWMMLADIKTYLPGDILTKVDRASMAVSLESRAPFLDHRIYEYAATLPLNYKIHKEGSKRVLRDVLYRYVPKELVNRPKKGFGVPLENWLRGGLKEWADDIINSTFFMHQQNHLNVSEVKGLWDDHKTGKLYCPQLS